ncbi:hypothetical protein [Sphingorhabdus sp.]|uniref:hypothetical protein n=1 Tax=Sphingorhabdus sp. TaxID=1902408 RepID=UPI0037C7FBFD
MTQQIFEDEVLLRGKVFVPPIFRHRRLETDLPSFHKDNRTMAISAAWTFLRVAY